MMSFVLFLVLVLLALAALCLFGDPYREHGYGLLGTYKRAKRTNQRVTKGGARCHGSR